MLENPAIWRADVKEQYELVHAAGGMVIHAHPYREVLFNNVNPAFRRFDTPHLNPCQSII